MGRGLLPPSPCCSELWLPLAPSVRQSCCSRRVGTILGSTEHLSRVADPLPGLSASCWPTEVLYWYIYKDIKCLAKNAIMPQRFLSPTKGNRNAVSAPPGNSQGSGERTDTLLNRYFFSHVWEARKAQAQYEEIRQLMGLRLQC